LNTDPATFFFNVAIPDADSLRYLVIEAEAGLVLREVETRINQATLHSLSEPKLRELLARFEQAGTVLFGSNPDPKWYVELRQQLLNAIEKKRVESSNRTLQIVLWAATTIVAFGLGWWSHDKKAPQTSAPPHATATAAPSPAASESPSATLERSPAP
jgi:hypothetical protein